MTIISGIAQETISPKGWGQSLVAELVARAAAPRLMTGNDATGNDVEEEAE